MIPVPEYLFLLALAALVLTGMPLLLLGAYSDKKERLDISNKAKG
jgi:hypothetical protein